VGEAGQARSGIKAQRGRTAKQAEPGSNLIISVSAKLGSDFRIFFKKKCCVKTSDRSSLKETSDRWQCFFYMPMAVFLI
jgi:hypothetical protein